MANNNSNCNKTNVSCMALIIFFFVFRRLSNKNCWPSRQKKNEINNNRERKRWYRIAIAAQIKSEMAETHTLVKMRRTTKKKTTSDTNGNVKHTRQLQERNKKKNEWQQQEKCQKSRLFCVKLDDDDSTLNASCGWKDKLRTISHIFAFERCQRQHNSSIRIFFFLSRSSSEIEQTIWPMEWQTTTILSELWHSYFTLCARMRQMASYVRERGSKCVKKIDTDATRTANNQNGSTTISNS